VCAADVVHAIHGLLSSGTAAPALLEHVKDALLHGAPGYAAAAAAAGGSAAGGPVGLSPVLLEWAQRKWTACWNEAYDSLAPRPLQ
jgi:hypothetical protein